MANNHKPGDPLGPGHPAWEAGDMAVEYLAVVRKELEKYISDPTELEDHWAAFIEGLLQEAKEMAHG